MNKKVSVIIPNWNGKELLDDCLTSLTKQKFNNYEIILVDNGSTDDSIEYTVKNFPKVKIVKLNKNYGFAKAINEGVKASFSEYVVFLNNDTYVDKNWLKSLVECANKHDEVISVNSRILNFYDRKLIDGIGIEINEIGQAKSIGWSEKDHNQYSQEIYIFGATGGASLFRKTDFIKVGMFDESFFMYSEEVDFAFRAQFLGYESIYCPQAIVYHKHKATSKKLPHHVEYWQFRNMTATIIKDFSVDLLLKRWRWLKILLVHLNTYIYQIKNGYYWAPFLADLWIIVNIPKLLKERSRIQKDKVVSTSYIDRFLKEKRVTFWGRLR